jgi:hypothetical protein
MEVEQGVYEHFKGGRYLVLTVATHSETQEPMVVYASLDNGEIWTRPLSMWLENVQWPNGSIQARFMPIRSVQFSITSSLAGVRSCPPKV